MQDQHSPLSFVFNFDPFGVPSWLCCVGKIRLGATAGISVSQDPHIVLSSDLLMFSFPVV